MIQLCRRSLCTPLSQRFRRFNAASDFEGKSMSQSDLSGVAIKADGANPPGTMSLAVISMLRRLSDEERRALERKCTFRRIAADTVVLDRFTPSDAVYFMVSG